MKKARALCFLLAAASFFLRSTSIDRIDLSAPLSGNQTLVSLGRVFELGFFTPVGAADGTKKYLGIWYAQVPGPTIVWVANRESPVLNPPASLQLSADGRRLVIVDAKNATVWSSAAPTTTMSVNSSRCTARLLDDGNFFLSYDDWSAAWQSFAYPTDTLLPGMKLGVDNRAGITRNITSWRAPTDPSPGEYTFKLVPGGLPQFFLFRGPATRIYTSGPWNGEMLTGVPHLKSQDFSFKVVSSPDEMYYSYSIRNASLLSREPCEGYARCGAFGYCDSGQSPICGCLPGFVPRSPRQSGLRDASGGCVRRTALSCDGGDGFWVVNRMKLPDATSATVYAGMTLEQCREVCLGNCSCRAYAAANVRGAVSGCVIWGVDLVDMRQYSTSVQDVYIRLAAGAVQHRGLEGRRRHHICYFLPPANHRRSGKTKVIAIVCAIPGVLLVAAICFCFWRKKARRKHQSKMAPSAGSGGGNCKAKKQRPDVDWTSADKDVDLPLVDLETILIATDHFSEPNKLGEGGFGPVYLGKLEDGQKVAVKRMSQKSVQGVDEFTNEVKLIAKLQHRNLVRLLGCCIDDDERLLVYEYMDNQSLDTFIFDEGKRRLLGWKKRFEIILGIARGLMYLHEDSRFRIIHRDMKASNVLLDKDMMPKISDFGIARMFGGDQTTAYTLKVIGTYGYMSPEYAMDGMFSMKSDVYALGVIVLEVVTGRKNRGFYDPELDLNLLGYAYMLWKEGRSVELVDEVMDGGFNHSEVLRCIQVELLCVDVQPRNRPTMSSVVMMLASENATVPEPNEPGVNNGKNTSDTESSYSLTTKSVTTTETYTNTR
ncbi:unnamed protein product [Urochloa decumbens]|uniref:Receptor-like serine/threonine-protein kinase n=1 Tax=Urochloa decumbens TaxID=240449 RepID=A0ABC9E875_9POAL